MAASRSEKRQSGFSLIELIVVLVILGLLAGLVTPAIMSHLMKARITITKRQISSLETALDSFKMAKAKMPTSLHGRVTSAL